MWTWRVENNVIILEDGQGHTCRVLSYAEPPEVTVAGDEAAIREASGQWAIYDLHSGVVKERRF